MHTNGKIHVYFCINNVKPLKTEPVYDRILTSTENNYYIPEKEHFTRYCLFRSFL